MNHIATTLAAMLAAVLAAAAFAQETTIKVPQGSGVLPTIGQVNCLEELGSGRLCAATYECSGESGRLWATWRTTMAGGPSAKIRQWREAESARLLSMAELRCVG